VGVLVDLSGVATIARTSSLSINDDLSINRNRRSCLELVEDVKSVSNSRGTSLSPARSTVARDVLVFGPREVILSVDVSPVDPKWIQLCHIIPGMGY